MVKISKRQRLERARIQKQRAAHHHSEPATPARSDHVDRPRDCHRCGSEEHQLKDCTSKCSNCGRVESWCTATKCTAKCSHCPGNHLSHHCPEHRRPSMDSDSGSADNGIPTLDQLKAQLAKEPTQPRKDHKREEREPEKECRRCGSDEHVLRNCGKRCSECGQNKFWCVPGKCKVRCDHCRRNHLTEKCDRFRVELQGSRYELVPIVAPTAATVATFTADAFPPLIAA